MRRLRKAGGTDLDQVRDRARHLVRHVLGEPMTELTLTMPAAQVNNSNRRQHWSLTAANRSLMRTMAGIEGRRLAQVAGPVHLVAEFEFPDRRVRDLDNFEIKGAIDGLVDARVLPDDDRTRLVAVTRRTGPGRSPKGRIRIHITLTEEQP